MALFNLARRLVRKVGDDTCVEMNAKLNYVKKNNLKVVRGEPASGLDSRPEVIFGAMRGNRIADALQGQHIGGGPHVDTFLQLDPPHGRDLGFQEFPQS